MLKLPFSSNMIHFPAILKPIHNNLSIKNGWSFPYLFKHKRWLCKEEEGKKGTLSPRWKLSPTLTTAPHPPYHLNSEKQQKPHQNHENEIFLWTSKSTHGGKMKNKNVFLNGIGPHLFMKKMRISCIWNNLLSIIEHETWIDVGWKHHT